jgi:hypothetical protein
LSRARTKAPDKPVVHPPRVSFGRGVRPSPVSTNYLLSSTAMVIANGAMLA